MRKIAQIYSPMMQGRTLSDLYSAVMNDPTLDTMTRYNMLNQLRTTAQNVSDSTPLGMLMAQGAGGIIGYLISKYFGAGLFGSLLGGYIGTRIGGSMYQNNDHHNGWTVND